jgi:hypothetical protein
MTDRAGYFDLLKRAEREPELRDFIIALIFDEEATAPDAPFQLALIDWIEDGGVQRLQPQRRRKEMEKR